MRFSIVAAIMLACPSIALSQQSQREALARLGITLVEPMSADQVVRTKMRVGAELARARATSVFHDISNGYGGQAIHRPSGLVCPLGQKRQRILVATTDSASCETVNDGIVYRKSVERAPLGATVEWAAAYAQSSAEREPGYKPATGLTVTARPKAGSSAVEHRTLRYVSRGSGRERAVRVQVGLVRGWMLTERKETRKDAQANSMADILSEVTFGTGMKQN
jgi:hypothetical protein